jgi:hypothetical protein
VDSILNTTRKEHDKLNRPLINRLVLFILVGLVAVDVLIVVGDLLREGGVDLLTFGSAVAVIGLCTLVWFSVSWGRWFLLGFIALRITLLGKVVASSIDSGEVLRLGALMVLLFYVGSAVVLASPIARWNRRGTT